MAKFHSLEVEEIRKETVDTVSVVLSVPEELKETFRFKAGQYLTLRTTLNDEEVRRSYSICSAPEDGELRVAIKQVEEGRFSTFANEVLKEGDFLDAMPPMGNFCVSNGEEGRNYAFFAAGSGITPVLSIIKDVLSSTTSNQVMLFYGNRGFDSIIFREELEGLKNSYLDRFQLVHVLSRESLGSVLNSCRINSEKCDLWAKTILDVSLYNEYFVCGPEEMIKSVSGWLESKGVEKPAVHFELFTSPVGPLKSKPKAVETTPGGDQPMSNVDVVIDGDTVNFDLAYAGESILDAAHKVGGDLPFACKGGVCCTCRAKVLEGEAEMDINFALSDEEVSNGFILTCQAHPKTERLVVTFDEV